MINVIANQPLWKPPYSGPPPTIKITIDDPEWDDAYANWLNGKNPTKSPEWKKGIFASYQPD